MPDGIESDENTREHWRWVVLASMADYIDAGAASLPNTGNTSLEEIQTELHVGSGAAND